MFSWEGGERGKQQNEFVAEGKQRRDRISFVSNTRQVPNGFNPLIARRRRLCWSVSGLEGSFRDSHYERLERINRNTLSR